MVSISGYEDLETLRPLVLGSWVWNSWSRNLDRVDFDPVEVHLSPPPNPWMVVLRPWSSVGLDPGNYPFWTLFEGPSWSNMVPRPVGELHPFIRTKGP